jgi:hypothetical protein
MHRRCLASLKFEQPLHYIELEDCIAAVKAAIARRDRLEAHIKATLPDWPPAPVVRAPKAFRGLAMVSAATLMAELGDIIRFTILANSWRIAAWQQMCMEYPRVQKERPTDDFRYAWMAL